MRIARLLCPRLELGAVELPPEEAHHLVTVLRAAVGQKVALFDGRGQEALGAIEKIAARGVTVRIDQVRTVGSDLPCRFTVAVAPPRQHRASYLVEKCTELGAAAFWPMLTARSTVKPQTGVQQRWTRRALEAAKQSQRGWIPEVAEPQSVKEVLRRKAEFEAAVILHADPDALSWGGWILQQPPVRTALILIGPEGGWDESELEAAVQLGFDVVELTPTVLRTETCAVAACAAFALWAQSFTDNQRNEERC